MAARRYPERLQSPKSSQDSLVDLPEYTWATPGRRAEDAGRNQSYVPVTEYYKSLARD